MPDEGEPARAVLADWGTSKLRLWLWYGGDGVSAPLTAARGMKDLATAAYPGTLEEILTPLGVAPDLPVLICGMAGARGGWQEAGYLAAPTPLDALAEGAIRVTEAARDVRILPGICMAAPLADVMRGEETQLAGLGGTDMPGLVCLPGTHSKWATLADGRLERFTTYMTGELFALLTGQSILARTLDEGWNDADFRQGVAEAVAAPQEVWQALFGLRAATVLDRAPWRSGRARLSGLLIGAECAAAATHHGSGAVTLVADGRLAESYSAALAAAGFRPERQDGETITRRGLIRAAQHIWSV